MAALIARKLRLTAQRRSMLALPVAIDAETSTLSLRLPAQPEGVRLRTAIVIEVDGEQLRCEGSLLGGEPSVRPDGRVFNQYALVWQLPMGYFGESSTDPSEWVNIKPRRLGQTAKRGYRAWVEFELLEGSVDTEFTLEGAVEAAPRYWQFHHSIAYDTATSATEEGGTVDWDISVSFTAGAGSNRVAIVTAGTNRDSINTTHSVTYGGASATIARVFNATDGGSYQRTTMDVWKDSEIGSGAKTVRVVGSGGSGSNGGAAIAVVSLSGVHQTTPYGGVATAGSTTAANPSATATSVGSTDLVVDGWVAWGTTHSVGANQTSRVNNETDGDYTIKMSTQAGSDGGVMSWTINGGPFNAEYAGGAAAFKEASGTTPASLTLGQVDGVASPTLTISTKGFVVPGQVDGIAAPTLALRSPHKLSLSQIDGVALPQATVSTKAFIVPGQVDGVAVPSLSAIVTLPYLTLSQVDGVAAPTAAVISRALLSLGQVDGVANITAALKSPYLMTLTADGVASLINTLSTKAFIVPASVDGVATAAAEVETPVLAGTVTIYAENDDGYIFSQDSGGDWTKVQAGTGDGFFTGTTNTLDYLGIREEAGSKAAIAYLCRFDTSAIPDGAHIKSATLSLYGVSGGGATTTTDTLEARIFDWGAAITTADWKNPTQFSALTRVATFATSGYNGAGYNDFTEDGSNFKNAIVKDGYTYLYILSSQFAAGTNPTDGRGVLHYNADESGTSKDPKLVIEYTAPVAITAAADGVATADNLLVKSKSLLTLSQVDGVATVAAAVDTTGGAINPQVVSGVATAAAAVMSRALLTMQADGVALPTIVVSTKGLIVPGQVDGVATAAAALRSAAPIAILADGAATAGATVASKILLTLNADGSASPTIALSTKAILGSLSSAGVASNEMSLTILFRPRVQLSAGSVRTLRNWGANVVVLKNQAGRVVRSGKIGGGTVS